MTWRKDVEQRQLAENQQDNENQAQWRKEFVSVQDKMKDMTKELKEAEQKREEMENDSRKEEQQTESGKGTAVKRVVEGGHGRDRGVGPIPRLCVILTDFNGRGVMPNTVKDRIPRDQRADYKIKVETAYTLLGVIDGLRSVQIDVKGVVV
jgi:hypothetical protein